MLHCQWVPAYPLLLRRTPGDYLSQLACAMPRPHFSNHRACSAGLLRAFNPVLLPTPRQCRIRPVADHQYSQHYTEFHLYTLVPPSPVPSLTVSPIYHFELFPITSDHQTHQIKSFYAQ